MTHFRGIFCAFVALLLGAVLVAAESFPPPLALPPNVTLSHFQKFLDRAASIVGNENVHVVSGNADFAKESYLDPSTTYDMFHLLEKDYLISSAVVAPRSVADVQALMKLCNELLIPIWPFSIGRNVGYGGAAPRVRGTVGVDLGRHMNKIIEVNVDSAYAVVEPGVTFADLHKYLVDNNLRDRLWVDVPDVGGGSLIGNTVERGVGYTPYGDHWGIHCGMDVVLPDGNLWRSGMGGVPNPKANPNDAPDKQVPNEAWNLFSYGFGPYNDGIFSQSSLGVVVKMGISLMPNPGGYQGYMISLPKDTDLAAAVEVIRPLRISSVIQNAPTLRSILHDAAIMGTKASFSNSTKPLTDAEQDQIAKKLNLGRWNFYGAVYGPDAIRNAHLKIIKAAFLKIPGAKYYEPKDQPKNFVLQTRSNTMQGIPSTTELNWVDWIPHGAHLFFSPIAKTTGADAMAMYNMTRSRVEEAGLDFFGTFAVGMREMHHIVSIVFDRNNKESRDKAHWLVRTLTKDAAKRGWGEYRTHLGIMDDIADTYSFNNGIQMKLNQKIKAALDPNGILAPGKNGIWPSQYNRDDFKIPL